MKDEVHVLLEIEVPAGKEVRLKNMNAVVSIPLNLEPFIGTPKTVVVIVRLRKLTKLSEGV